MAIFDAKSNAYAFAREVRAIGFKTTVENEGDEFVVTCTLTNRDES